MHSPFSESGYGPVLHYNYSKDEMYTIDDRYWSSVYITVKNNVIINVNLYSYHDNIQFKIICQGNASL